MRVGKNFNILTEFNIIDTSGLIIILWLSKRVHQTRFIEAWRKVVLHRCMGRFGKAPKLEFRGKIYLLDAVENHLNNHLKNSTLRMLINVRVFKLIVQRYNMRFSFSTSFFFQKPGI